MSDEVSCEHCGEMFSPQGISTHERYCGPDESEVESEPLEEGDALRKSPKETPEGEIQSADPTPLESRDTVTSSKPEPTNNCDNYSELEAGTSSAGVLRSQSELRLEQEAIDRDDGMCLECRSEDELTVHVVDPDDGDRLANRMTLCPECEEEYARLRPLTKRSKAWH
jgi:hypothetical protein